MNTFVRWFIAPAIFYTSLFAALTTPAVTHIHTLVLTDTGDGLQNLWNLWWVHKALTELHQSPWHTTFIHFPYGISLVSHTLNPFNGFLATPLLHFFSLGTTYNLILIFSFVAAGIGGFWLGWDMTRNKAAALLAGALITFSAYHFAHAEGHLQLVALEGIPFFLWSWLRLLQRAQSRYGIIAGLSLNVVVLCDYYYLLYCAASAAIFSAIYFYERRQSLTLEHAKSFLAFFIVAACVVAPLLVSLLSLRAQGLTEGAHPSDIFSMDLQSLFIPGGHWRFAGLTTSFWSSWTGNRHETNLYLGWIVIALSVIGLTKKDSVVRSFRTGWIVCLVFFFIMALGPHLHVGGRRFDTVTLPYGWLERWIPVLKLSGCPVRMAVMVNLAVAIFAASGFKWILTTTSHRGRWMAAVLGGIVLETLPAPLPETSLQTPPYIRALQTAPGPNGVLDAMSTSTYALYYQTVYDKPMALGYTSRIPDPVWHEDQKVIGLYQQGEWGKLYHQYHLQYVLIPLSLSAAIHPPKKYIYYEDHDAMILNLGE